MTKTKVKSNKKRLVPKNRYNKTIKRKSHHDKIGVGFKQEIMFWPIGSCLLNEEGMLKSYRDILLESPF